MSAGFALSEAVRKNLLQALILASGGLLAIAGAPWVHGL